ncbi:MAG: MFS transporter [Alphaproteobacteria bacterium]|nr:MAG: MFS transporter [Alphaproteobacteria bacterium]
MNNHSLNPRAAAVRLLTRVLNKNQLLDEALDAALEGLEGRDRSLARAIASTALRHLGILDALIDKVLDRPLPQKAVEIRHILKVGMTQLIWLDIPAHAAVYDTVALLPDKSKYKGLVNALLRRTDRQGTKLLADLDQPKVNTPVWLWDSWSAQYGEETARAIATAHLEAAPLDITPKADPEIWAERLGAELLPTGSLRLSSGRGLTDFLGYDSGDWWVQDSAAALPAKLFGDVTGKTILDLCAAPGGKTAQLAAGGAFVTALDRSKTRLSRLQDNLARLHLTASVIVADAEEYRPVEPPEGILLDAPCSSTGTIRRHPDVAWLKSEGDVEKLAGLQSRLLDRAAASLKEGGILVYSVCSLQREEGEAQIETLLARDKSLRRMPVTSPEVGGLDEILTPEGDLRCLPSHPAGMDGFFAARLMKITAPRA